jgi:hypothetical protein
MECHCYDRGLVPVDCSSQGAVDYYRNATQISSLTPDQVTDKYLPAISSAVHMGSVREVRLRQSEGCWSLCLYAVPGNCATQIANYLFQTD